MKRSISMPAKSNYHETELQEQPKQLTQQQQQQQQQQPQQKQQIKQNSHQERESVIMEIDNDNEDEIKVMSENSNLLSPHYKQPDNSFIKAAQWSGSTIELTTTDFNKNEGKNHLYGHKVCRVIEKNGYENVTFKRIPQKSWRYMRDFVTTLIELEWKYMLTLFVASYFITWLLFAIFGYIVSYTHGDFLIDDITGERLGSGKNPCVVGVYNFISMLLYSIETQTTIGFGEKYPTEECLETLILFLMQIICSIAIEGGMVSIIYAKTARPVRNSSKLKFSDKAVICYRDGKLCLLFRVCDDREQQAIHSKIRVYMIIDRCTREGEIIKTHTELKLVNKGQQIITWPEIICHIIDDDSPLKEFTCVKDLSNAQFELYVSIVGVSPTTAQVTEARTSYIPQEIFWGQRFVNIITYDEHNERYVYDYKNFNTTIPVDMNKGIHTHQT